MKRENELEWLYREIARMSAEAGLLPHIPLLTDPISLAGNWARDNPDKAYRLALDIRNKLVQAFG